MLHGASGSGSFQILYEQLSNFIEIISQNIYYGGVNVFCHYDNFHLQIKVFQLIWMSLTTGIVCIFLKINKGFILKDSKTYSGIGHPASLV